MIERSLKRIILIITLVLTSALFAIFGGVSFLNSANPSPITVSAADESLTINKIGISNISSSDFTTVEPIFTIDTKFSDTILNKICSDPTYYRVRETEEDEVVYRFRKVYYRPAIIFSTDGNFPDVGTDVTGNSKLYSSVISGDNIFDLSDIPNMAWSGEFTYESKYEENLGMLSEFKATSKELGGWCFKEINFIDRWTFSRSADYYFKVCLVKVELSANALYKQNEGKKVYISDIVNSEVYTFSELFYSLNELARMTEDDIDEIKTNNLYSCLGVSQPSNLMTYTINYKEMTGYATYEDKSATFSVSKYIFFNVKEVEKKLYAAKIVKNVIGNTQYYFEELSDFNVNFFDTNGLIDGEKADLSERIIFQAQKIEVKTQNAVKGTGVLSVKYSDFKYKDFFIKVTGNETIVKDNLTAYFHSTNVTSSNGYTSMTYEFDTMEKYLWNNYKWLVELKSEDFYVDGTEDDEVEVTKNDRSLVIKFKSESEEKLANLKIIVIAEIVEDKEYTMYLNYEEVRVKGDRIEVTSKRVSVGTEWLSKIKGTYTDWTNVYSKFGKEYIDSSNATILSDGKFFYRPVDSSLAYHSINDNNEVDIIVEYEQERVFYIINKDTGEGYFKEFITNCVGSYFGIPIPNGYRLNILESEYAKVTGNSDDLLNCEFYFQPELVSNVKTIEVRYTLTDKWKFSVEYLQNYTYIPTGQTKRVPSGFAEKKTLDKEVSLNSFADRYNPTEDELKEFLGFKDLAVIGTFGAWDKDNTTVEYKDGVYYIKLAYYGTILKIIKSDGGSEFLRVGLTSFKDWTSTIGKDWSILSLNYNSIDGKDNKVIFKSEGDISPENLYGYFYTAVFNEKVTNINSLFSGYSSEGCRVFYQSEEIKGSDLYKFIRDNPLIFPIVGGTVGLLFGHPAIGVAMGTAFEFVAVAALENKLKEDNSTYYTYFSYIDGSSDLNYAANNKADDVFDNDSAVGNTGQDIIDNVKDWVKDNADIFNQAEKVLKAILGVVIILIILSIALKFVPSFIKSGKKIKTEVKKNKESKEPKSKG